MIGAVTLVTVNAAVSRLIASSTTAARIFDGGSTTVISDGHGIDGALRRLGLRRSELPPGPPVRSVSVHPRRRAADAAHADRHQPQNDRRATLPGSLGRRCRAPRHNNALVAH
jgi:hypothetical protein